MVQRNYHNQLTVINNLKKVLVSLLILLCSVTGFSTISIIFELIQPSAIRAQNFAKTSAREWNNASFPVENFQRYTSPFGYRNSPTTGESEFHSGLDFAAPLGSYIRNWWHGKVVELSDHTACGTKVVIQSGQWQHVYCHLQGIVKETRQGLVMIDRDGGIRLRQGQHVETGVPIGRVGMTGRTVGPHLHWELKHAGELVNPALVLEKMYQQQQAARQSR